VVAFTVFLSKYAACLSCLRFAEVLYFCGKGVPMGFFNETYKSQATE
jgi:hypothetical protein